MADILQEERSLLYSLSVCFPDKCPLNSIIIFSFVQGRDGPKKSRNGGDKGWLLLLISLQIFSFLYFSKDSSTGCGFLDIGNEINVVMAPMVSKRDATNTLRLMAMFPLLRQSVAESLFY